MEATEEKKKGSWVAVCPKCERMYNLTERRLNYFCAPPKDCMLSVNDVSNVGVNKVPEIEKVECKVVFLERKP